MPPISRGFRGRRREGADAARIPPGQYVTTDFPVLSAGPTPHTPLDRWDFSIVGEVDEPRRWTLGGVPRPAERGDHRRHPLRHQVVEARHRLGGVSVDTLLDGVETVGRVRDRSSATAATRPTCRSRTSRAARPGSPSNTTASRSSPSTAARRGMLVPHLYFWKSAKWVRGLRLQTTTSRASGRSTATTTTATRGGSSATGATDAGRLADVVDVVDGDAARQDDRLRRPGLAGPPRRPARRRPADRRGRLPGAAQLLDRVGAARHAASS